MRLASIALPLAALAAVASALPSTTSTTESKLTPTKSLPVSPFASRRDLSNAERLRDGLPLKNPRRRHLGARQAAPSATPCGRLMMLASDGSYNGYVSSALDSQGRFFVTPDPTTALQVVYSNHRLVPANGPDNFFLMGATFGDYYDNPPEGPGNNNFEGNSGNFAVISGTSDTPYGAPAQKGSTSYVTAPDNFIEAAIFRLDLENNEILPTWINTDGTPRLSYFGMPDEGLFHPLVISMNIGSYNAINGGYSARMFCESGPGA